MFNNNNCENNPQVCFCTGLVDSGGSFVCLWINARSQLLTASRKKSRLLLRCTPSVAGDSWDLQRRPQTFPNIISYAQLYPVDPPQISLYVSWWTAGLLCMQYSCKRTQIYRWLQSLFSHTAWLQASVNSFIYSYEKNQLQTCVFSPEVIHNQQQKKKKAGENCGRKDALHYLTCHDILPVII